jgi:hypothetical protein
VEDLDQPIVRVPALADMDDETIIKHLEARHGESLKLQFRPEPDRVRKGLPQRLFNRSTWEVYHRKLHELYDGRPNGPYRHTHKEPS